jgi:hypothetical protein
MRLTTLARKIQITPTKLIEYLKKNDIAISNGVHTILDEKIVTMVLDKFSPLPVEAEYSPEPENIKVKPEVKVIKRQTSSETATEIISTEIVGSKEILLEAAEKMVVAESAANMPSERKNSTPKTGTIDDLEQGLSEEIELIKAKKVKLEGIRVIGKIDIPEKVKKVQTRDEESKTTPSKNDLKSDASINSDKQKKKFKTQKSLKAEKNRKPLTYEEKLKLEEKEKVRLQKQKARKDKERKKKFYLKNIQPKTLGQPKKKRKNSIDEGLSSRPKDAVQKNLLRRFWDWLNGVYDQY